MRSTTRYLPAAALAALLALGCTPGSDDQSSQPAQEGPAMPIAYLEIVTGDVDAVCAAYAAATGLEFGDPDPALGNARTAARPEGGLIGVRAPMRSTEQPVVRPYLLVEDIEAAVAAAAEAGAEIALPPMELPGHGTCAIYLLGGVEHGLWQR